MCSFTRNVMLNFRLVKSDCTGPVNVKKVQLEQGKGDTEEVGRFREVLEILREWSWRCCYRPD